MLYKTYPYGNFLKVQVLKGAEDEEIDTLFTKCYNLNAPNSADMGELRQKMLLVSGVEELIKANRDGANAQPSITLLKNIGITYEQDYVQWLVCGSPESNDFIKTERIFHQRGLRKLVECELLRGKKIRDVTRYVNLFIDNIGFKVNSKHIRRYAYLYWQIYFSPKTIYANSLPRVDLESLETYMAMGVFNERYSTHRQYLYGDKETCDGLQGLPITGESISSKILAMLGTDILNKCESGMSNKLTKPEVQLYISTREQVEQSRNVSEREKEVRSVIETLLERVNTATKNRIRSTRESMGLEKRDVVDTSKARDE